MQEQKRVAVTLFKARIAKFKEFDFLGIVEV